MVAKAAERTSMIASVQFRQDAVRAPGRIIMGVNAGPGATIHQNRQDRRVWSTNDSADKPGYRRSTGRRSQRYGMAPI